MKDKTELYLKNLLPEPNNWVADLEDQAEIDHIPIMDPLGINFLMQQIRIAKPNKILEIGTAIGYSALRMLEAYPKASIVTIERDEHRYEQAISNIGRLNKQEQIKVVFGDALEVIEDLAAADQLFDFIFIDAAKGQYRRFFDLANRVISSNGIILSDNVLFRDYVINPEDAPKRFKKMSERLQDYNTFLMNHPDYTTTIIPIGDGVAVSLRR